MATKINGDTTVSEDSLFRLGKFTINSKRIDVPLQAIDLNKQVKSMFKIPKEHTPICEIYRSFTPEKLERIQKDGIFQQLDEREIQRIKSSSLNHEAPSFLFTSFKANRFPNQKEVKDLINISYTHSDATPIPALPEVFKRKMTKTISRGARKGIAISEIKNDINDTSFQSYLDFLSDYIDKINEWNHKDILGIVPPYFGSEHIRKLVDFYYGKGVHHFYFDCNTRMFTGMLNSQMVNFIRRLKEVGLEYEKTFIYSLNSSAGKFSKEDQVIGAKDILTSGAGMDVIGKLHIGGGKSNRKFDPRVGKKLIRNTFRLFNKDDYGYYKAHSGLPFSYPKDSAIPEDKLMKVTSDADLVYEKIFNMEQLAIESQKLREYIEEKHKPLDRIKKEKKHVNDKDIKALRNFRENKLKAAL